MVETVKQLTKEILNPCFVSDPGGLITKDNKVRRRLSESELQTRLRKGERRIRRIRRIHTGLARSGGLFDVDEGTFPV